MFSRGIERDQWLENGLKPSRLSSTLPHEEVLKYKL